MRSLHYYSNWIFIFLALLHAKSLHGATLVIQIDNLFHDNGTYRLDYSPPHGKPAPNTTFPSQNIGDKIHFSDALPGTKYNFWLYYSNSSLHDSLARNASITTVPDPPTNLTITVKGGKSAHINFSPPAVGGYSYFILKVRPLAEKGPVKNVSLDTTQYTIKDLTPGGTYEVQLFTVYEDKESLAYISKNFTTKPSTPGKFIVWFRNETTLLVLWQPSFPTSIYTHYKVSIEPADVSENILLVEKEGEPPGPAQAAFKSLVPGRAYNISVQTVSEGETSIPTTAQYRTIPLVPSNLQVDKNSVTSNSFRVTWDQPKGESDFDKYQITVSRGKEFSPISVIRSRNDSREITIKEKLHPGLTYQVVAKTFSGKVASWPATLNVTLKPLPVLNLKASVNQANGEVTLSWKPSNESYQENYKISYAEIGANEDANVMTTDKTIYDLESLLPGRNYSVGVQALANQVESDPVTRYVATKPSSPIIKDVEPIEYGLNISWKSDVNSRQDQYEVIYQRNDSDSIPIKKFTTEPHLLLTDLYPGATYKIQISAISLNLYSEPHDYNQTVFPRPPSNLTLEKATSNSVVVRWKKPEGTIFDKFSIRYHTGDEKWIVWGGSGLETEVEIVDLIPGERYTIEVNTVSKGVVSARPLTVNHTVRPSPASNIAPLVDSTNITLEFPRPEGRIEFYVVEWEALDENEVKSPHSKNISGGGNEGATVRALVEDLIPGVKYKMNIHTVSYNLHSDSTPLMARTMPLILSEVVVVNTMQSTDTVILRYTRTPASSSRFDKYRFSMSTLNNNTVQEKSANDSETKVTFTGLIPGCLYNITIWTVSDKVLSQPLHRQDRLYPEPVSRIRAVNITDTTISLTWDIPRGEFDAFEVQYQNTEGILIQNLTNHEVITIWDLKPHRNYTFTIIVRSGMEDTILRRSLPVSDSFTTQEGVPGMVEGFRPTDVQPSFITFSWILPDGKQNGKIRNFTITYGVEGSNDTKVMSLKSTETRGTIRLLIPGKTYLFRIQAETKVGFGPEAIWKQKMPILAPPKPSSQTVPTEVYKTSSTIQIRFRQNYFSNANGVVTLYTIVVAEDDSKNSSGLEMPSWKDVQAYSVWPPYQVLEPYNPFKNNSVEDFTIGTESCEGRNTGYCNGPLKGGTAYKVKIRAFTAPDKFTDTFYSFSIQTDQDTTPLVVGITVPIVLMLVLFLTILLMRKYKLLGRRTVDTRGNDNMSLPDSIIETSFPTSRPVRLENFAEHYRLMSADSDFRFSEEFEELKHIGRDQPCTFADLPCNRPKNRFTNILPYDHSRFKLQPVDDEEGSDYINANYVPGHNSPREFIVTQGPLHSTRDDFWRMCWESNSRAIVMLTRCIEKGREKCDHYWPYDTMPVYYGDISVTILNDSHYPDWTVTEFIMQRGEVQRVIRHFHFTTWPDFGVPNPPQTLVRFVRAFRERISPDQRPIVVHCSAGVGRSGTFIALDRILQSLSHCDHVDIFGIVYAMRKERVWMVQTEQQYICIHQCLLAVLEGDEGQNPPREIHHNQGFEDDEGIVESGM